MRGLGIGIFVSVLILCLTQKSQGTMTDEQIRERALELGMIDSTGLVLSDLQKDTQDNELPEGINGTNDAQGEDLSKAQPEESVEQTGTEETKPEESVEQTGTTEIQPEESVEQTGTTETQSEESGEQTGTEETKSEESVEQSDTQSAEITVEILKGATSYSVSKELESAGLIESARAFDEYLCGQGYSKSIRAGVYTIKSGESEAEIAKIITGKR